MGTAILTPVAGLVKVNSIAFKGTHTATDGTMTNAVIQALADVTSTVTFAALCAKVIDDGRPLFKFLNTVFANDAAAADAYRAIGGKIILRQVGGTTNLVLPLALWKGAGAVPTLTVTSDQTDTVWEIVLEAPHSLVQ